MMIGDEEDDDDNLTHPRGQVDIAALLPVEHLGDEAGLERHHRHDEQGHREYLDGEMIIWIDLANSYYLIISKKLSYRQHEEEKSMIVRFLDICRVDRVGHLILLLESTKAQCANLFTII